MRGRNGDQEEKRKRDRVVKMLAGAAKLCDCSGGLWSK
jgi:hypothetical protein